LFHGHHHIIQFQVWLWIFSCHILSNQPCQHWISGCVSLSRWSGNILIVLAYLSV
jgi:hypothetical protein